MQNESPVSELAGSHLSLHHTAPGCFGMGHLQPRPKAVTALPPASAPLFPAFLSEVSESFSDTPTVLPPPAPIRLQGARAKMSSKLSHRFPRGGGGGNSRLCATWQGLGRVGVGKAGQPRQRATVPATAAPRLCGSNLRNPRPPPSPHRFEKRGHPTTRGGGGGLVLWERSGGGLLLTKYVAK